jgi:hypothetical protein
MVKSWYPESQNINLLPINFTLSMEENYDTFSPFGYNKSFGMMRKVLFEFSIHNDEKKNNHPEDNNNNYNHNNNHGNNNDNDNDNDNDNSNYNNDKREEILDNKNNDGSELPGIIKRFLPYFHGNIKENNAVEIIKIYESFPTLTDRYYPEAWPNPSVISNFLDNGIINSCFNSKNLLWVCKLIYYDDVKIGYPFIYTPNSTFDIYTQS